MRAEAASLLALSQEFVSAAVEALHELFVVELGGVEYVKTIYVGYEIDGQMVAAAYPQAESLEVALPLPEDDPSPLLIDATHLTWRTMPVACKVTSAHDISSMVKLARIGADRVRTGAHDVDRPTEFFMAVRPTRGRPKTGMTRRR